jgi:hypothetical protein
LRRFSCACNSNSRTRSLVIPNSRASSGASSYAWENTQTLYTDGHSHDDR